MTESPVLTNSKRDLWYSRYQRWQSSGLSAAAFSRQNDLNLSTFYYWKKVFDRASGLAISPQRPLSSAFIPVAPFRSVAESHQLTLTIADVTLNAPRDATEVELTTWLRAMRAS